MHVNRSTRQNTWSTCTWNLKQWQMLIYHLKCRMNRLFTFVTAYTLSGSISLSPRKLKINLAIYITWNQLIHKCILKLCLYYYLVLVFNYFWYGLSAEIFWVHNAHRRKWFKISTFWLMSWREEIILIFRLSASLMLLLVKTFKLSWEKKNNL